MTVCVHLCRGNFKSAWVAEGGYEPVAEVLFNELEVDGYFLEYDDARSGDFAPLRFVPKGKTVVLGLVTTKLDTLEIEGRAQAQDRRGRASSCRSTSSACRRSAASPARCTATRSTVRRRRRSCGSSSTPRARCGVKRRRAFISASAPRWTPRPNDDSAVACTIFVGANSFARKRLDGRANRTLRKGKADIVLRKRCGGGARAHDVLELRALQLVAGSRRPSGSDAASTSSTTKNARRATRAAGTSPNTHPADRCLPDLKNAPSARASARTSATARFMPLAPVGGTMCAASPARNRRPYCIGSATKLRIPVMPFSSTGPSRSRQPSLVSSRRCSSRPDALVRPAGDVFLGRDLQVEPRDFRRTHAVEREAAVVIRVDQFVVRRRRLARMPNHANGYVRSKTVSTDAGIAWRQIP